MLSTCTDLDKMVQLSKNERLQDIVTNGQGRTCSIILDALNGVVDQVHADMEVMTRCIEDGVLSNCKEKLGATSLTVSSAKAAKELLPFCVAWASAATDIYSLIFCMPCSECGRAMNPGPDSVQMHGSFRLI